MSIAYPISGLSIPEADYARRLARQATGALAHIKRWVTICLREGKRQLTGEPS